MAFKYKFSNSGFNTIITVYQDNTQIYTTQSATAGRDVLLREAKLALKDNYPGSENMTEDYFSSSPPPPPIAPTSSEPNPNLPTITLNGTVYMPGDPGYDKALEESNRLMANSPLKQSSSPTIEDISLTPEERIQKEYDKAVEIENKNYEEAKKNIQERKQKNQKAIDDYKKDPFKKQKDKVKKRKESRKKAQTRTKEEKKKARKDRANTVLKNGRKTLVPIATLLLTNELAKVVSQNDKIKKLVDNTNAIITDANQSNDPTKLSNAKVVRDTTIKIIQDNENKIKKISKQIENISIYISIFSIIANALGPVILSVPVPSPAPDVVTPPKETFRRKVYEPALQLLNGLSALLPIATSTLQKAIDILENLKSQLLDINGQLDTAAAIGIPGLNGMQGSDFGIYPTEYKGFKFSLKEETGPNALVVAGNKRHYAIAINKQNVEVIKSDYSFTLDPNDLIDQLKLVIDSQNLIA
jgi:hypothetical protein